MHIIYGLAEVARSIYQEEYPNRDVPDSETLTSIHLCLFDGNFGIFSKRFTLILKNILPLFRQEM